MLILKRRKLRVDILTIFITLLLLTSLAIISYSYFKSTKATLSIAEELIIHTNESTASALSDYLNPPAFIKIAAQLLSDRTLEPSDMQQLTKFLYSALSVYPQLDSVYIADTHGNIFVESRAPISKIEYNNVPFINAKIIPASTRYIAETISHPQGKPRLTIFFQDEIGNIIKQAKARPIDFDPRTRPWFIGAKTLNNQFWMGVYKFYNMPRMGISAAFPIKINNRFNGVIATDININNITNFLRRIKLNKNNVVFIVNSQQQIIADADNNLSAATAKDLPTIANIQDAKIRTAYRLYLQTQDPDFVFKVAGVKYIVAFSNYAFNTREKWEVASIVPLDNFIGATKRIHLQTLVMSLLMLVASILLIVFFAHRISRPIMYLAKETRAIKNLQFDKPIVINSPIFEIQALRDALNSTKSVLSSFAKYVPKSLVAQLLQSGLTAEVGGEKKEITLLFTDIKNFTEIAEKMAPEALMLHLSDYMNVLSTIIHEYQGNVDKYMGDAIMAFWGAPLADKEHCLHACRAALMCVAKLNNKNAEWRAEGKPVFSTRFGLHTGTAIVGNMGSSDRLNYTAIGDAVNVAARLEAVNKEYGTSIIVSQAIYDQCVNDFKFRLLNTIEVRGRTDPIRIYELIAIKE